MSNQHDMNDSQLDEALARFTDELLESDSLETIDMSTLSTELHSLQETAALLRRSVGELHPPLEMASRIKSNLMDEWEQSSFAHQSPIAEAKGAWWEKASSEQDTQPTQSRRPFWQLPAFRVTMAGVSMIAIVFVFALAFSGGGTNDGTTIVGTATGGTLYLATASIIIGGIALYFLNQRSK